jgi:hypothetical protein
LHEYCGGAGQAHLNNGRARFYFNYINIFEKQITGQLHIPPKFNGHIVIGIVGDNGGKLWPARSTKLGLVVANNPKPNSPRNIQLLAVLNGPDSRANLEQFGPVFEQLNQLDQISYTHNGMELTAPIKKFVGFFLFEIVKNRYFCADLKFTSAIFGHQGATSSFPCIYCLAERQQLGKHTGIPRTAGVDLYHSIPSRPLLNISPNFIVPPSFHLVSGIAQRLIDLYKDRSELAGTEDLLSTVFARAHAKMDSRKQTFKGFINLLIEKMEIIRHWAAQTHFALL